MTKIEFETKIKQEKLVQIHDGDNVKTYIEGEKIYNKEGDWVNNEVDVYGCFYNANTKEAVVFITDSEKGMPNYMEVFDKIEDAYDDLFNMIKLMEDIYRNKKCC